MQSKYGITLPLEDLLVSDPFREAARFLRGGMYFGKVFVAILGTPCHHIAFSTDVVDWQLWIEDGPRPFPRKARVTYKLEDASTSGPRSFPIGTWPIGCRT